MTQVRNIALLTLFFAVAPAFGQEKTTSNSANLQKPVSGTDRVRLGFLAGNFTTETYIPPSPSVPKGATGKGTSVITWALDSMFLFIEEQSTNSLFGEYTGHGVLGYDSQSHKFVLSMFNNSGDRPTYNGNYIGDTLVLGTKVPMPGRSFDQKLLWYKDGDAVRLKVLNDSGKGFLLVLEQTAVPVRQETK